MRIIEQELFEKCSKDEDNPIRQEEIDELADEEEYFVPPYIVKSGVVETARVTKDSSVSLLHRFVCWIQ